MHISLLLSDTCLAQGEIALGGDAPLAIGELLGDFQVSVNACGWASGEIHRVWRGLIELIYTRALSMNNTNYWGIVLLP